MVGVENSAFTIDCPNGTAHEVRRGQTYTVLVTICANRPRGSNFFVLSTLNYVSWAKFGFFSGSSQLAMHKLHALLSPVPT